eukprot:1782263-Rhodomonas_salina.2
MVVLLEREIRRKLHGILTDFSGQALHLGRRHMVWSALLLGTAELMVKGWGGVVKGTDQRENCNTGTACTHPVCEKGRRKERGRGMATLMSPLVPTRRYGTPEPRARAVCPEMVAARL